MTDAGRVYGGRSERERRADRRARLLAAGLDLFGTEGWTGATIEKLCTAAGVATRSFYEEFSSREALLLAVFEDVLAGVVTEVTPRVVVGGGVEAQVRAGLTGYVEHLTADPRRARVVHHEIRVAGTLEDHRQAAVVRFADLISQVAQPEPRPETGPLVEVLVDLFLAALPH
jgi:AcrR family transcriptional regulator